MSLETTRWAADLQEIEDFLRNTRETYDNEQLLSRLVGLLAQFHRVCPEGKNYQGTYDAKKCNELIRNMRYLMVEIL